MVLAELIRDARKKKGWSIADLARRAGLDRALVSRIESGHLVGSASTQADLAQVLDLDPGAVLLAAAGHPDEAA